MLFEITPVTLFYLDAKNQMRVWTISVEDSCIKIEYGALGGKKILVVEQIDRGKAGRTVEQQLTSRFNSRVNKQLLRGYKPTLKEARLGPTNSQGLAKPMLAQTYGKVKKISYIGAQQQFKFNGMRMLIKCVNGKNIAYTREGKLITTLDHIVNAIQLKEGDHVDGECYCHGESLQTIVSWVKRKQLDTYRLVYRMYDCISDEFYTARLAMLQELEYNPEIVQVVNTEPFDPDRVQENLKKAESAGYEGLIIRLDGYGYESAKRSKSLIKVKSWQDAEFEVTDIELSEKGRRAVVYCRTNSGVGFKVTAPGDMKEKHQAYVNKEQYIGKVRLTVSYFELTKDGVPFHPVALFWENQKNI